MAAVDLHVHVGAGFTFGKLRDLVGIVKITPQSTNGSEESEQYGLAFTDVNADGSSTVHVIVLDEEGRANVIQQMTPGRIVVPKLTHTEAPLQ